MYAFISSRFIFTFLVVAIDGRKQTEANIGYQRPKGENKDDQKPNGVKNFLNNRVCL